MPEFDKYMHVENIHSDEVEGILNGKCYIFPKLNGMNEQIWVGMDGTTLKVGTRNKEADNDKDSRGLIGYISSDNFLLFFYNYPNLRLYGEWLVHHTIHYKQEAYNHFYVFDVLENTSKRYMAYENYKDLLEKFDIKYIPVIDVIEKPSMSDLETICKTKTDFLMPKKGDAGEGIVIKDYDFTNKYGRTCWGKLKNEDTMQVGRIKNKTSLKAECVEDWVVNLFCTEELVNKTHVKITNESQYGWKPELIPKLLGIVWHDFVVENIWDILKKTKNATIDFELLRRLVTQKVKTTLSSLF